MSNSYTPPDRSTYDPGWNDPPPMPLAAPQLPASAPGKLRISLNKRVAFPMQSSGAPSASSVKTTAEGLPLPFSTAKYQPPAASTTPLPAVATQPVLPPPLATTIFNPSAPPQVDATESITDDYDSAAAKQLSHSVFARLVDAMATHTDAGKLSEIRKRLETLDQMWHENKLNESAQKNLYELAKALENKDTAAAMEQHRLLVTQHINVSTQWATALRQIILSISPESELESQNAPAILPETEIVQFVDISTKPIVLDSVSSLPIEPTIALPMNPLPLPVSNSEKTLENNSIHSASAPQSSTDNETKSKFGRIGRILHL